MEAQRGQSSQPWSHTRAIFAFAAIVGVCPVIFSEGQLKESTPLVVYSTVVFLLVFHNGFAPLFPIAAEYNNACVILANITSRVFDVGLRSVALISFLNATSYKRILEELQEIDAILSTMRTPKIPLSFSSGYLEVTNTVLFCVILLIYGDTSTIHARHTYFNLFMTLVIGTVGSQFLALGVQIDARLQHTIACLLQTDRCDPLVRTRRVEVLSNVHSRLCDIVELLGSIYSVHLLIMATNTFFFTTTRLYILYYLRDYHQGLFYVRIYWTFFYYYMLWRVSACCHNLSEKLRDFNSALFRFMVHSKDREILDSGKLRLHIAMQREATITAYGFFPVDYTLIYSIISSTTTYLLILIQIEGRTDEEMHGNAFSSASPSVAP